MSMTLESAAEINALRARIAELEATLLAIQRGEVDALVIQTPTGPSVFTLEGADLPYRHFVEQMQQGALTLHDDGAILYCNRRMAEMLDSTDRQLLGRLLHDFVLPEHRDQLSGLLQSGEGEEGTRRIAVTLSSARGRAVPVHLAAHRFRGGSMSAVVTDLAEQRLMAVVAARADALVEANARVQSVLDSITDLFIRFDLDWRVLEINRTFAEALRFPESELIGHVIWDKVPRGNGGLFDRTYREAVASGRPVHLEAGSELLPGRWYEVHAYPDPVGLSVYLRDVTERKQVELVLRENEAELEARVQKRTDELRETNDQLAAFSYSVAHDLRAPIRAIRGYLDVMLEEMKSVTSPLALQCGERITGATVRMDRLISELLSYGRLGKAALPLEVVPVRKVVEEALRQLEAELHERGACVTLEIDATLPPVRAHPPSLTLVFTNLVSNAVKFVAADATPEVVVGGERFDGHVRVWVEDNGIGIAPEYHERIFGVFEQLHRRDQYPGTGVGLAMVKRAMERMDGRVGVESTPGRGSRFWLEIPIA
jgi:PAS domain S-box-containing protein